MLPVLVLAQVYCLVLVDASNAALARAASNPSNCLSSIVLTLSIGQNSAWGGGVRLQIMFVAMRPATCENPGHSDPACSTHPAIS